MVVGQDEEEIWLAAGLRTGQCGRGTTEDRASADGPHGVYQDTGGPKGVALSRHPKSCNLNHP
ncbi:hypothetical protein SBA4_1840034 [Candidatus Sulfopaludibacter sp. SbA4]|nr:hypothetical protein SBA4_1840034 [Candidatus Sulfopaludibacter sp. SbA4]